MSYQGMDVVSNKYSPDILPAELKDLGGLGINFIIFSASPNSQVNAVEWIRSNYGLERYDVPIEERKAWEVTGHEVLDERSVVLTTGSVVDLGNRGNYPWLEIFRETILRQAVYRQLPIIAPCFGLAELTNLYAENGQDPFPKGVRELGRVEIIPTGNHPIFYGLTRLTGYVNHNGSVSPELLKTREELTVQAVTPYSGDQVVPALVTFTNDLAVGTSFHREVLDKQTYQLFGRTVGKYVKRFVNSEAFMEQEVHLRRSGLISAEIQTPEIGTSLVDEILSSHDLTPLQRIEDVVNGSSARDYSWIINYLQGTTYLGEPGYNPLASQVFFDNLLRMFIHQLRGIEPPRLGIGETL